LTVVDLEELKWIKWLSDPNSFNMASRDTKIEFYKVEINNRNFNFTDEKHNKDTSVPKLDGDFNMYIIVDIDLAEVANRLSCLV
jgi:hypothetical protein